MLTDVDTWVDTAPERQSGRKAQMSNITAAKVRSRFSFMVSRSMHGVFSLFSFEIARRRLRCRVLEHHRASGEPGPAEERARDGTGLLDGRASANCILKFTCVDRRGRD